MHFTNCNFYITCNEDIDKIINKLIELDNKVIENNNISIISTDTIIPNLTNENRCILKDNKGEVTSDYGFTYENLSAILALGEYSDFIKDGDWIELTTIDNAIYKMYANIDTYYGEGEKGKEIGHHIDFISDNLIYGSTSTFNGKDIFGGTDYKSWRMNNNSDYSIYGNNNGVIKEQSPFLANSSEYRDEEGGIIDKLNEYYVNNIPDGLKNHIIKKYHKIPIRYNNKGYLTDDNGCKWDELPYLWIPYEKEIHSRTVLASIRYESHMKQYHSFKCIPDFKIKADKKDTGNESGNWWTASANYDNQDTFCCVYSNGKPGYNSAQFWMYGAPLCFRFQ